MPMDEKQRKRDRITALFQDPDIRKGITLEELCDLIADLIGLPISMHDILLPWFVSGFVVKTKTCYHIYYDESYKGHIRDGIIIHELFHLLCGDVQVNTADPADVLKRVRAARSAEELTGISCRTITNDQEWEEEIERAALRMKKFIVSQEERAFQIDHAHWLGGNRYS